MGLDVPAAQQQEGEEEDPTPRGGGGRSLGGPNWVGAGGATPTPPKYSAANGQGAHKVGSEEQPGIPAG